jgi:hypothetical protein
VSLLRPAGGPFRAIAIYLFIYFRFYLSIEFIEKNSFLIIVHEILLKLF